MLHLCNPVEGRKGDVASLLSGRARVDGPALRYVRGWGAILTGQIWDPGLEHHSLDSQIICESKEWFCEFSIPYFGI